MERELLTRNFMTGWVLIAGFLAAWLPRNYDQVAKWFGEQVGKQGFDLGSLATVALAVLTTPIIGYAISALVLVYMYARFGEPYSTHSRIMAERLAKKECPRLYQALDDIPNRSSDLFGYLVYRYGPETLIEWGRRRHTTRFIGCNWTVATTLGLVFGATLASWPSYYALLSLPYLGGVMLGAGCIERWLHELIDEENMPHDPGIRSARYQPWSLLAVSVIGVVYAVWLSYKPEVLMPEVLVLSVAATVFYLGIRSGWEVEHVERLWIADYISRKLRARNCGTAEEASDS